MENGEWGIGIGNRKKEIGNGNRKGPIANY
jgi:hypothetical protein